MFDGEARIAGTAYSEFEQHFPRPGWVEHDATEIWETTRRVAREAIADAGIAAAELEAIGITNQRETVVAWDPDSGEPIHRALVWQDRRTAERCAELRAEGREGLVRERTGLVLDPYFSATKIEWLLRNVDGAERAVFGTIDSWLLFKLTGRHATDRTNASRTMLFDIRRHAWDEELCAMLGIDPERLPEPLPSAHVFGTTTEFGGEVPVAGIAGDQQAALFGQACHSRRDREEHLRDRELRPPPHRGRGLRPGRRPADHGRLRDRRVRRLRAGGLDLRHRRRGPVAARRARDHRCGGRDRGARGLARGQRRRLLRPGAHRARLAALGPLRPRHDRRPDPGQRPRPPGAGGARGDRLPDRRRGPRPGGRRRPSGWSSLKADGGAVANALADAVPGRRPRRPGDRPRGRPRRPRSAPPTWPGSRPAAGPRRTSARTGARPPASSRRWTRIGAARCSRDGAGRSSGRGAGTRPESTA